MKSKEWVDRQNRDFYVKKAKKIALALETEISGDVERRIDERPTESLIAWDNYLKGIEYSYVSNRLVDIEKSQEYFDNAFRLDPNFASALAKEK